MSDETIEGYVASDGIRLKGAPSPATAVDGQDQPRAKVSLREQADEAAREVERRERNYPSLVLAEVMSQVEAAVGIYRMRAIAGTLALFAEHEDAVRAALAAAIKRRRQLEDAETIRDHPAVRAVATALPDAEITVSPIEEPEAA